MTLLDGFGVLDRLSQDLVYALRGLRRSPGFTSAVVCTIALGVGANAAIFSFLDRLLFAAPTGIESPGMIRRLYVRSQDRPDGPNTSVSNQFSYAQFAAIRDAVGATAVVASFSAPESVTVGRGDAAFGAIGSWVSPEYFPALGVRMERGRSFGADEARIEIPARVAIISYAFWTNALRRDSAAVGRDLEIDKQHYTVIGIAAPGFAGVDVEATGVFLPLNSFPVEPFRGTPWYQLTGHYLNALARLPREGGTRPLLTRATLAYDRMPRDPRYWTDTASVILEGPIIEARGPIQRYTGVAVGLRIAGVALLVLAIACANVANLLLARATRRKREVAIRLAVGVSRSRLFVQLLTESLVLATLGGIAAIGVAWWGGTMLRNLLAPGVHWAGGALDTRLVVFTALAAALVGIAAGLAPVWFARGQNVLDALKGGARDGGYQRSRLRGALLMTQTALSVVLVVGAGLLLRSLNNVEAIRLGYDADSLVFVSAANREAYSRRKDFEAAIKQVGTQMRETPGVLAVAYSDQEPMHGYANFQIALPGRDSLPRLNGAVVEPSVNFVSTDFFRAVGMRIVLGRTFSSDAEQNVLVVNELMAKTLWPGENPIGKCVLVGRGNDPCNYVIGVSENAHRTRLVEVTSLNYFMPSAGLGTLIIRVDPKRWAAVGANATANLRRFLPSFETIRATHMRDWMDGAVRPWRVSASLFTALGTLALIIAVLGVYSVVAYAVGQRVHEMGVRIALGAQVVDILQLIVGEGFRLVAIGVVAGVGITLALGRLVESLLYGVTARDPGVIVAAACTFLAVAIVAALIPALRAAHVDPALALRAE